MRYADTVLCDPVVTHGPCVCAFEACIAYEPTWQSTIQIHITLLLLCTES